MKLTMHSKAFGRLLSALFLGACLLIPAAASASGPGPTHERPLGDAFSEDFFLNVMCGDNVPYLHEPMLLDLTTPLSRLPAGYFLAFRSRGMLPENIGVISGCDLQRWQYDNQKMPFDEGTMTGRVTEQPQGDGTALIHVTLHYDNLPFRVYSLNDIFSACGPDGCDTSMYKPIVVDGRMSMQFNWEFVILSPGSRLSDDNIDWSQPHQAVSTGQGVGTFTGYGGFPTGAQAVVNETQMCSPAQPQGNPPHWDGCPAEKIDVSVQ